jgi:hypothetical protein
MAEDLLSLQITDHARIAYTALGPEDRRLVDAWFDHLRNWRSDEFIRSRSRRLKSEEEIYVFQTSTDIIIAFKIDGNKVIVLSIFRKEALRTFESQREPSTA